MSEFLLHEFRVWLLGLHVTTDILKKLFDLFGVDMVTLDLLFALFELRRLYAVEERGAAIGDEVTFEFLSCHASRRADLEL